MSCESHWSTWDSLYTLSEEEVSEAENDEDEGQSPGSGHNSHTYCSFCKENINMSLCLTDRLELMEKKLFCLLKIKSELTNQLTERTEQVECLEKEVNDLKDLVEKEEVVPTNSIRHYRKSILSNIKKQVLKSTSRSASMPEKLDCISNAPRKREKSLLKTIKKKAQLIGGSRTRTTEIQHSTHSGEEFEVPVDIKQSEVEAESFVSRWSNETVLI